MYILLLRAAITGIFGSAFGKWFLSTRVGIWFQVKLDTFMEYLAVKYDIHLARKEEKWRSEFPHLAARIDKLEKWAHPAKELHEFEVWPELDKRLEALEKKTKIKK